MKVTKPGAPHYFLLAVAGVVIIMILGWLQRFEMPLEGEYFYSQYLRNNYTWLAVVIFSIAGFFAAYLLYMNPWLVGFLLLIFFPATSIVEASVYKGSHNLIPFELLIHIVFMAPVTLAAFAGRHLQLHLKKQKQEIVDAKH